MVRNTDTHFLLLQLNDAFFPIGAYAHSYSLETYIQQELVHDRVSAAQWLGQYLKLSFLYSGLLPVRLAYEAAVQDDQMELRRLESRIKAAKAPMELRQASQKLGTRLVKTVRTLKLSFVSGIFIRYADLCKMTGVSHAVAYGVLCADCGIEKSAAIENYLYAQTSGIVNTCVKSVPLSQTDGQRMLLGCQSVWRELLIKLSELSADALCLSTPGMDIRSMQHEILYSRLYMS